MRVPVGVVAFGARNSLGLTVASIQAAVYAGINGIEGHPFLVDQTGDLMPGAMDGQLEPRMMGADRLLAMAETALGEVCSALRAPNCRGLRLPVYLALPEPRPGFGEQDADAVRRGIEQFEGLPIEVSGVRDFPLGHAAGFAALETAIEDLESGASEACIVGGVDSYFHPDTLEWLDENRQLVGAISRSGFVPGEGAAFSLLMSDATRDRLGLEPLSQIQAVAVGREEDPAKTKASWLGEGLTDVVRAAVSDLAIPEERVNCIYCDINGERYRGEEWGFVCLRLPQYFDSPAAYNSPADLWGDVGAASLPLLAMLASKRSKRSGKGRSTSLLWASSAGGLRGAAVLVKSVDSGAPRANHA